MHRTLGANSVAFIIIFSLISFAPSVSPRSCTYEPMAVTDCEEEGACPDLTVDRDPILDSISIMTIDTDVIDCLPGVCVSHSGVRKVLRFDLVIKNIGDVGAIVGRPPPLMKECTSLGEVDQWKYDECSGHWYSRSFVTYEITAKNGTRHHPLITSSMPSGWCVSDYSCHSEVHILYNCDLQGIGAGCSAVNKAGKLCQWIDITDLGQGDYTLVVTVNRNREIQESNYGNNKQEVDFNSEKLHAHTGSENDAKFIFVEVVLAVIIGMYLIEVFISCLSA